MGDEGLERITFFPTNNAISSRRAAESGAIIARSAAIEGAERRSIDPRLMRLINAWDALDEVTRNAIIAIVGRNG